MGCLCVHRHGPAMVPWLAVLDAMSPPAIPQGDCVATVEFRRHGSSDRRGSDCRPSRSGETNCRIGHQPPRPHVGPYGRRGWRRTCSSPARVSATSSGSGRTNRRRCRPPHQESGDEPQPVPGRVLWPLLEQGSLEEDDDLRRTWAVMLANAARDQTDQRVFPAFPHILAELSAREVLVLEKISEAQDAQGNYTLDDRITDALRMDHAESQLIRDNLVRLQLLRRAAWLGASNSGGRT